MKQKKILFILLLIFLGALCSCKQEEERKPSGGVYIISDGNNTLFEGSSGVFDLEIEKEYYLTFEGMYYYDDLIYIDPNAENVIYHYQDTQYELVINFDDSQEVYVEEANTFNTVINRNHAILSYNLLTKDQAKVAYNLRIISHDQRKNCVSNDKFGVKSRIYMSENGYVHLNNSVTYGSYPQSLVTDNELINKLKGLVNESNFKSLDLVCNVGNDKYQPSDIEMYQDIEYNGNKYRAIYYNVYKPTSLFYFIEDFYLDDEYFGRNNKYYLKEIYFFKFEDVEWNVLEVSDSNFLLISTMILDAVPLIMDRYSDYVYDQWIENIINKNDNYDLNLPYDYIMKNEEYGYIEEDDSSLTRCKLFTDYADFQGINGVEKGYLVNRYNTYKDYASYWINENIYEEVSSFNLYHNHEYSYINETGYCSINSSNGSFYGIGNVFILKK